MAEFVSADKGARPAPTDNNPEEADAAPAPPPAAAAADTTPYRLASLGRSVEPTEAGDPAAFAAAAGLDRRGGLPSKIAQACKTTAQDYAKVAACVEPDRIATPEDFDFKSAGKVNNVFAQLKRVKLRLATAQEWLADTVAQHGHLECCKPLALEVDAAIGPAAEAMTLVEQKLAVMVVRFNQSPQDRRAPSPEALAGFFRGTLKGHLKTVKSRADKLQSALGDKKRQQKLNMFRDTYCNELAGLASWAAAFFKGGFAGWPLAEITAAQLRAEIAAGRAVGAAAVAAGVELTPKLVAALQTYDAAVVSPLGAGGDGGAASRVKTPF